MYKKSILAGLVLTVLASGSALAFFDNPFNATDNPPQIYVVETNGVKLPADNNKRKPAIKIYWYATKDAATPCFRQESIAQNSVITNVFFGGKGYCQTLDHVIVSDADMPAYFNPLQINITQPQGVQDHVSLLVVTGTMPTFTPAGGIDQVGDYSFYQQPYLSR